jgi:hypothetical protein
MIRKSALFALAAAFLTVSAAGPVQAGSPATTGCSEATFAAAVDKFGATLRNYNAEAQPRMRARLTALADKKGWTGEDREERAMLYLEDGRLGELDTRANELLSKVDQASRPGADGAYDCSKLAEIEAASIEILAVMKAKASYLEDKVAREVGPPAGSGSPPSPAVTAAATPEPQIKAAAPAEPAGKDAAAPQTAKRDVAREQPTGKTPTSQPDGIWDTKTKSVVPAQQAANGGAVVAKAPDGATPAATLPPITLDAPDEGYTIDEIREASRGFFGTISTNLASVIEYTFANSGRPTGYILGTEGGGAFLAGLRYGKGTLYLRAGGTRPIHWHGPSLGYDVGADGGRTLILVYRMRDPDQLYRSFTGVDGSAYLVGGVGMTLLKGGDVIMAPIRSGLGLRLGANIGYLRFTSQPTWNPF